MPSNYAHYRFGTELIEKMEPEQRRTVRRFRQLFDMGLHGPDLFFHHDPFLQTSVRNLGKNITARRVRRFLNGCAVRYV